MGSLMDTTKTSSPRSAKKQRLVSFNAEALLRVIKQIPVNHLQWPMNQHLPGKMNDPIR
jgi:hypothetical protein